MAAEYGMTVLQLNDLAARNPDIDREIDAHLKALYGRPEPAIVDSRLGWHFIPSSFKVYLVVDPVIAAERVYSAIRPDEPYASIEAAAGDILKRQKYENERFTKLYSIKCDDWHNYDLIIDTSHATPEQVADLIWREYKTQAIASFAGPHCWLSPKRLVPTQNIRDLATTRAVDVYESVHNSGFDERQPIDIGLYDGYFLIIDGHLRTSAVLRLGIPLISCNLRAADDEFVVGNIDIAKFALTSTSLSWIYDWEEAHNFRFKSYPGWLMAHQA